MKTRLVLAMLCAIPVAVAQEAVAGHVTLPVDEYNRLLELAARPPSHPDAPPMAYAVQSADLKMRVDGETVTGRLQLEGQVFEKGQVKARLATGMTILDAVQNGRPLPLLQEGGVHSAVLVGPEDFSIALQVGLPLTIEPGRASFTLPAPAAGTVRMELTVPGEFTSVNVSPGLVTDRVSAGGKTTVQATLAPGKPATVWWAARLAAPAPAVPKEMRFLSDVKTLVTVGQEELAVSSLAGVTVVQGEPGQFDFELPAGFEVTGATGATLVGSEVHGRKLTLRVDNASARSHQFLISIAKPLNTAKTELALPGFTGSQRETGEVLIEGVGTMELAAGERGGLRRMDIKEGSAPLRALAKHPVHAAFRYQRKADPPGLAMEWVRFPDTPLLSAIAPRAVVTTLVTSEGRSLTEVRLTVKNREQTFLKVALPAGAQILSAEVAGEKVKPVTGPDGDRVPLLRTGFRPTGDYVVSFVFLHSGAPFAKKGGSELALPKMDVPIGLVTWEVFLPRQYKVAEFGGDALSARLMPVSDEEIDAKSKPVPFGYLEQFGRLERGSDVNLDALAAGQIGGYVVDPAGALVPGALVTATLASGATLHTFTDARGRWMFANVPAGRVQIRIESQGFKTLARDVEYDASRPGQYSFRLDVGNVSETVEVTSAATLKDSQKIEREARQNAAAADAAPSLNVTALQNRVVGVLPIAVNVPHTGNSYHFVRPLVVDEETRLTFSYRIGKS